MACGPLWYGQPPDREASVRAFMMLSVCLLVTSCAPSAPTSSGASESEEPPKVESAEADDEVEGELITAPAAGSPEAVIQGLIAAAMYPDEAAGWKVVRALLHSSISNPRAIEGYRQMNYAASRRKVALFTPDDTKPHFRIVKRDQLTAEKLKLFIHNEKSMPTPCTLTKDAEADGAWKVYVCSL